MGDRTPHIGLVAALSELAASVQRGRTHDDIFRIAGDGVVRLGVRFLVFQIDRDELVLRYVAMAPDRHEAVEQLIHRGLVGLRAPLDQCGPAQEIVSQRRIVYRSDLDLFLHFVEAATGKTLGRLDPTAYSDSSNGVVAPLFVRDEPWGLLSLVSSSFRPEDAAAAALFA